MKKIDDNLKEKEEDPFITILKSYTLELTKSKAASKKFLVDIGVMTKKGNLTKNYRALANIPSGVDIATRVDPASQVDA